MEKHFAEVIDPRGRTKPIEHPLFTIIFMAFVAVLCGANDWEEIAEDAKDRAKWHAQHVPMPHGVPSASTFERVLGMLSPREFSAAITSWIRSLAEPIKGEVVAFDGKTLRGALRRKPFGQALHQVHVWAVKQSMLLAHRAVDGAKDEPAAIRELLKLVALPGAVATADAAHCSRPTAQAIVDSGAEYLLALKGNRQAMFAAVDAYFTQARMQGFGVHKPKHTLNQGSAHGRYEIRESWTVPASELNLPGAEWPSLKTVTLIERTRIVKGNKTTERHFYVSSLPPSSYRRIAQAIREHWRVENGLHWILDVQMREDQCRVSNAIGAQNLAMLRRLALSLLKRDSTVKRGVEARGRKASRNPAYLEHVLLLGI